MWVRILGSAAGGGLPQWNCRCHNCRAARRGDPDVLPRTQSSVAISADRDDWFLLNVSADIRQQLLGFERLWPTGDDGRSTSVVGCVLTDAEIDHTSGLLQLREGCAIRVFSTATVQRWLSRHLPIAPVLAEFADRPWTTMSLDEPLILTDAGGRPSGLSVVAFEAGNDAPRFVPRDDADRPGSVVGLEIRDEATGGTLVYAPGIEQIGERLVDSASRADGLLIDGTFWSDDEPIACGITDRTARQMGHVPVSGSGGTLEWFGSQPAGQRFYIHINNTNPMLNRAGDEHATVVAAGVTVGADGDEFEI